jgi:hypothetical protein
LKLVLGLERCGQIYEVKELKNITTEPSRKLVANIRVGALPVQANQNEIIKLVSKTSSENKGHTELTGDVLREMVKAG